MLTLTKICIACELEYEWQITEENFRTEITFEFGDDYYEVEEIEIWSVCPHCTTSNLFSLDFKLGCFTVT